MKKLIYASLVVICSLFFTSMALAKDADKPSYSSMQKPVGASVTASSAKYLYEIQIINYSSRHIDIYVPVLSFSARLYPYYGQYIFSNNPDPKRVILYDQSGFSFFDQLVWDRQIIEVYDRLGHFEAQVK